MWFIGSDISEVLICDITEKNNYNLNTILWITSSSVWCVSWVFDCQPLLVGPVSRLLKVLIRSTCFSLFRPYLFEKL